MFTSNPAPIYKCIYNRLEVIKLIFFSPQQKKAGIMSHHLQSMYKGEGLSHISWQCHHSIVLTRVRNDLATNINGRTGIKQVCPLVSESKTAQVQVAKESRKETPNFNCVVPKKSREWAFVLGKERCSNRLFFFSFRNNRIFWCLPSLVQMNYLPGFDGRSGSHPSVVFVVELRSHTRSQVLSIMSFPGRTRITYFIILQPLKASTS